MHKEYTITLTEEEIQAMCELFLDLSLTEEMPESLEMVREQFELIALDTFTENLNEFILEGATVFADVLVNDRGA